MSHAKLNKGNQDIVFQTQKKKNDIVFQFIYCRYQI